MPLKDLPLDFQADNQEEDHHQAFIDPGNEWPIEDHGPDAEMDGRVMNGGVEPCKRCVGGDQTEHQGRDQSRLPDDHCQGKQ